MENISTWIFGAYALLIVATSLYALYQLKVFPSLPPARPTRLPKVSIIVPARNEGDTISECVRSLIGIEYPEKEIIVVAGASTDDTSAVLKQYGGITILQEPPLPEGWIGKNWACHVGYGRATGELLLFTDGDTVHSPESLKRTVGYLLAGGADMVSILPRLVMRSRWERLLLPTVAHLILLRAGGPSINKDGGGRYFANGQYLLFRRYAYEKVGGHRGVRDRIVEDMSLARKLKTNGFRVRVLYGAGALRTQMYRNFGELWEGWVKNSFAAYELRVWRYLGLIAMLNLVFVAPFITLLYGLMAWPTVTQLLVWSAIAVAALYLRMGVVYHKVGAGLRYSLLFPAAIILQTAMMWTSAYRVVTGKGVIWKGRLYRLSRTGIE